MIKKIAEFIRKYQMIEPHDTIAAGISGGADSVCLFFILLEVRKQIPFNLKVVHVNHGIRTDAGEDAEFVRTLCEKQGIPFLLVEKDVKKLAKESGRSAEEEGRLVRYEAFAKALGNERGKIAVAHNSNDRAETMLFHLF
ncbi:MAG: tRNA lysidine(34) synthetase TilS, partial [Lachnospiraceae bacterium]|nr:tRNA lysidine(34) synthetase TilS [Lachnospiraceae bacterium]